MDSKSSTAVPMEPAAIRRRGAEDRISALPVELLHTILRRLPSAADAARTTVLSRRWPDVWAQMPTPFDDNAAPATTFSALLDSIDAALKPPAAPTFRSLKIDVGGGDLPAHRISPWLRVAGELLLRHRHFMSWDNNRDREDLALPIYKRATKIYLHIIGVFLRPPPTGSFSLLTDLRIDCGQMDGGELGRVVSSLQCPRLRKLRLVLLKIEPVREVSICSETLECFRCAFLSRKGKLEVTAPMLQKISVKTAPEACIVVAPKLEKVHWHSTYDPDRHQFVVAGRHLRSLRINHLPVSSTRLMERFDTVSDLRVSLALEQGIAGYTTFLKEMDKLPICETLDVVVMTHHHTNAVGPMMLHLLRRCYCIRRFKLDLNWCLLSEMSSCTTSDCPCHLTENYRLDDITFNSIEEIEISFSTGSAEQTQFVELLLSRCNTVILERVDFTVPSGPDSSEIMEVVQRIRSMCHPNSKVQFNVHAREEPKLLQGGAEAII